MGKSAVWGHFLHTQRSLAQLFPYATCMESSHPSVRMLQVRPIYVGFLVFKAIHVGTLQLHFKIEPWDFLVCRVGHVFHVVRQFRYACFCTCSILVFNCVQHLWHLHTIISGCFPGCQLLLHGTSGHIPLSEL